MEAIFHEDPRVQEWLDLIIEKLFTSCLLTGSDAEKEFQKGRNAVERIAMTLHNVSALPPAMVYEGVQQLIEQKLPDRRVIVNFPVFHSLMEQMLKEGIQAITVSLLEEIKGEANVEQNTLEEKNVKDKNIKNKNIDDDNMLNISLTEENAIPAMTSTLYPSSRIRLRDVTSFGQNSSKITIKVTNEGKKYEIPLTPQVQISQQNNQVIKDYKETTILKANTDANNRMEIYNKNSNKLLSEEPESKFYSNQITEKLKGIETYHEAIQQVMSHEVTEDTEPQMESKPLQEKNNEPVELIIKDERKEQIVKIPVEAKTQDPVLEEIKGLVKGITKDFVKNTADNQVNTNTKSDSIEVKRGDGPTVSAKSKIIKKSNIPSGSEKFALLLQQLYPKAKVRWDRSMAGYNFLAQVEDLLFIIRNNELEIDNINKEMKDQGWKVVIISNEDLQYPRRIEREIKFQLKQKINRN